MPQKHDDVEDTFACIVCCEMFARDAVKSRRRLPRLLECDHTLCHACVEHLAFGNLHTNHSNGGEGMVCCPVCRHQTKAFDIVASSPNQQPQQAIASANAKGNRKGKRKGQQRQQQQQQSNANNETATILIPTNDALIAVINQQQQQQQQHIL
jgi:hypothetical protein